MIDVDKKPLAVNRDKKPPLPPLPYIGKLEKTPSSPYIGKYEKIMNEPERLRLICNKCGKDWTELRPKGYYVRCEKNNNFLINRCSPYDKKLFKCPKCRCKKNIGRLPAVKKNTKEALS